MARRETLHRLRLLRGPKFVSRMIVVTLVLVLTVTLASGAAAYLVAILTVEDEIEFAGQSLAHSLSGSIVTIITKPGAEGELQVILNNSLEVDTEGRVADALIISKDLKVVAAKDPSQVGQDYSQLAGLSDLQQMQTVTILGEGTRIAAPVQWGKTKKRTLGYVVITLGEQAFMKARGGILISFAILLSIAALATVVLTRRVLQRLLKPVVDLGDAARALAAGDSDYPLEAQSDDEIGMATESFLKMRAAQRIFVRFSNPALVREILDGRAPDRPVDTRLAIGFGDGVRFTDWSGAHTAGEISSMLSDYFTVFGQLVVANDGIIEKFMGDAVMSYYGLHRGGEDHGSSAALRTHIAGQILLPFVSEAFRRYHGRKGLQFRFGLATGRCVVGPMGARGIKLDYTIVGSSVNLASRLEGMAEPGGLAIDRFTYLNVDGERCLEAVGPTPERVKGFVEPIQVFRVLGYRTREENDRLRQTLLDLLRSESARAVLRLRDDQFTEFFAGVEKTLLGADPVLPLSVRAA